MAGAVARWLHAALSESSQLPVATSDYVGGSCVAQPLGPSHMLYEYHRLLALFNGMV